MNLPVILAVIVGAVVLLVLAAAKKLITDEVVGCVPIASARLIRAAARRLPEHARERYEEEWLGEVASYRDRRLSGFFFALRIRIAAKSTGAELREADRAAARSIEPSPHDIPGRVSSATAEAARRVIAALVSASEPPESALDKILAELRDSDLDVDVELARIQNEYEDMLERGRRPASAPELNNVPTPRKPPRARAPAPVTKATPELLPRPKPLRARTRRTPHGWTGFHR